MNILENKATAKEVFNKTLAAKQAGKTYTVIAKELNDEGYTLPSGGKITDPVLSKFMCERGFRQKKRYSKGAKRAAEKAHARKPFMKRTKSGAAGHAEGDGSMVEQIEWIMGGPFSNERKGILIQALF